MIHDAFYLIESQPRLSDHLRGRTDPDFAEILTEPALIHQREGDRTGWTAEDHATQIKILFLVRLREYIPLASDEDAARILGSSRISVDLFDRWWVVRRFVVEDNTEGLLALLRPVLGKVTATGNSMVDHWLTSIRDHD
jgi:hypothetical protein